MDFDDDYNFAKDSNIKVSFEDDGTLTVNNTYKINGVLFPFTAVYTGKKTK